MRQSVTLSVRLEAATKADLEKLARGTRRSKSYLAAEAIRQYVELNQWQVQETRRALAEADKGDFASDVQVRSFFDQWRSR